MTIKIIYLDIRICRKIRTEAPLLGNRVHNAIEKWCLDGTDIEVDTEEEMNAIKYVIHHSCTRSE